MRPVLELVLPPGAPRSDPGDRLNIDFPRLTTAADIVAAHRRVFEAVCRGEISPRGGARLVRRACKPLRRIRCVL
jgi:hypothetical protein